MKAGPLALLEPSAADSRASRSTSSHCNRYQGNSIPPISGLVAVHCGYHNGNRARCFGTAPRLIRHSPDRSWLCSQRRCPRARARARASRAVCKAGRSKKGQQIRFINGKCHGIGPEYAQDTPLSCWASASVVHPRRRVVHPRRRVELRGGRKKRCPGMGHGHPAHWRHRPRARVPRARLPPDCNHHSNPETITFG